MSEISASVDETNRIRAELGLPPLRARAPAPAPAPPPPSVNGDGGEGAAALRERLERRRKERLLNQQLKGSLGESLAGTAASGPASEWVKESRQRSRKRARGGGGGGGGGGGAGAGAGEEERGGAPAAKRRATQQAEEEVAALRVRHGADKIVGGRDGGEVTVELTLRDASVLDDDAEDELENAALAAESARERGKRKKEKKYNPYSEQYGDDSSDGGGASSSFRLGELADRERQEQARLRHEAEERERINATRTEYSLGDGMAPKAVARDFFTAEEMEAARPTKLKKRKKDKKEKKGKKSGRARERVAAAEAVAAPAVVAVAPAPSPASSGPTPAEAYARAQAKSEQATRQMLEADVRSGAAAASSALRETLRAVPHAAAAAATSAQAEKRTVAIPTLSRARGGAGTRGTALDSRAARDINALLDEEDDPELSAALERARRSSLAAERKSKRFAAESVAVRVRGMREAAAGQVKEEARAATDGLVLSSTTEFVRGIDATAALEDEAPMKEMLKRRLLEATDGMSGDEEQPPPPPPPPPPPLPPGTVAASSSPSSRQVRFAVPADNEFLDAEEQLFAGDVRGRGVAAMLALIRRRGLVEQARDTAQGRRSGTVRDADEIDDSEGIIHYDDYGRKLTPKEAFRELSRAFTGTKPGKQKREKAMRQRMLELKKIQSADAARKVAQMRSMQEQSGRAFVSLDNPAEALALAASSAAKKARNKATPGRAPPPGMAGGGEKRQSGGAAKDPAAKKPRLQ